MSKLYLMDITSNSPQKHWNGPRGASKKISESISMDGNLPNTSLQVYFLSSVKNKGHLIKFLNNQLTPAWVDVQQEKLSAVSMAMFFALGVLDAPIVVVRNDTDLLVEVIITAPLDDQLCMPRPSNSNTTVFDIARLPNPVGKCKIACSPYTLWLGVTLPQSYNQGKNITFSKDIHVLQKMYLPSICPRIPHQISTDIKFCYICIVSQIAHQWMHSDTTMHIHMPWWECLSMTSN